MPDVVLVREEVGHALPDVGRAEHRACRERPLIARVRPVLDAHAPIAVERVGEARDVARREDARDGRLQAPVDEDAVVDLDPGSLGEPDAGRHADARDHDVALDRLAVRERDPLDARRRPRCA